MNQTFKILFFFFVALIAESRAFEVQIATVPGPYFVDQPIRLQIAVSDCEKEPIPEVKMLGDTEAEVVVTKVRVQPQISSHMISINGRTRHTEHVRYFYDYQVLISKPGRYQLPAFEVSQGASKEKTATVAYDVGSVESDPDMFVDMKLDASNIYVGQKVPVQIRWGYAGDIDNVRDVRIRSSLFDQFAFEDKRVGRGDLTFALQTLQGEIKVACDRTVESINGRRFIVYSMQRTLIADQAGSHEFAPISSSISYVKSWKRGGFFDPSRVPATIEPRRNQGEPLKLEILPLPSGSPSSFAGAVGSGFRLNVDILGSTIVQVGDPIKLKFTLTGNGNIEQAGLPKFDGDGGFDLTQYRLPTDEVLGRFENNQKEFVANVRVTDKSANQIPPLAYSWFDPRTEKYETSYSEPISISVGETQVVSGSDVVSSSPSVREQAGNNQTETVEKSNVSLADIDLALTLDKNKLMNAKADQPYWSYMLYGAAIAVIGVAFVFQKRRQEESEESKRRIKLREIVEQVKAVKSNDVKDYARSVSSLLRTLLPYADAETKRSLDQEIAMLDDIVFSPTGQSNADIKELRVNTVQLSERVSGRVR